MVSTSCVAQHWPSINSKNNYCLDSEKDLLKRVTSVREEHDKKREGNAVLQEYIANLMNSNAVRGDAGK